jgi:hypothetical protein
MIKKLILSAALALASFSSALAQPGPQPGPGPVPDVWVTSGNVIKPISNAYTLLIDANTVAPTALTGTLIQAAQANGVTARFELDAFAAVPRYSCARSDGTAASPTTLQSADEICSINSFGYNGTAIVGPQAAFRTYAAQNWSVGANGAYADIAVTPNGSTTLTQVIQFNQDGGITTPGVTGGDKGAGTINAGGLYVNGTAVGTGANPTATGGAAVNNGSAITFMRSDASFAIALGSNSIKGLVECDGTTITCSSGIITVIGGAATAIAAGTTTISGTCSNGDVLYDNSAVLGCSAVTVTSGGNIGLLSGTSSSAGNIQWGGTNTSSMWTNTTYGSMYWGSYNQSTVTGGSNVVIGWTTGHQLTSGGSNTFINSGSFTSTGNSNTLIGASAGNAYTGTESSETILGACSGVGGESNSHVRLCDGVGNVVFHWAPIYPGSIYMGTGGNASSIGHYDVGIGPGTLSAADTGGNNVAIGNGALGANTSGGSNVAVGISALAANVNGTSNVAIGQGTLTAATYSTGNVNVGANSMQNFIGNGTSGGAATDGNIGIGLYSMQFVTYVANNVSIGYNAMNTDTSGGDSVAIGAYALYHMNITGSSNQPAYNTAVGYQAGYGATTGLYNAYIGYQAGGAATQSGGYNTLVGSQSGSGLTSGTNNTLLGYNSGSSITTGSNNSMVGSCAGSAADANTIQLCDGAGNLRLDYAHSTASIWTAAQPWNFTNSTDTTSGSTGAIYTAGGIGASKQVYSGTNIIAAGYIESDGGGTAGTGANIGGTVYMTGLTAGSGTKTLCLTASNQVETDTSVTICGISAARFKEGFIGLQPSAMLAGVNALRTDVWRYRAGFQDNGAEEHVGPIADDVVAMDSRCGVYDNEDGGKLMNYSDRCVELYLIGAVKELKSEVDQLRSNR